MKLQISDKISELQPSVIREILKYAVDPDVITLAGGDPAPESLPIPQLQELGIKLFMEQPETAFVYSQSEGYPPLREAVKVFAENHYGIDTVGNQVMITSGAQQGMDLVTKIICNDGDTVLSENPTFLGSLNCFRSYGAKTIGVPLETDGMSISVLEKALLENPKTKMIYVIPNFQNPTGITMSLEKRKAIYALALKYKVAILEDNPYGDLRFSGESVPSIKSLDTEGIVIYVGSFSKILSPGIRVGFVIASDAIFKELTIAKQCADVHTGMLSQLLVWRFLEEMDMEAHIERLRTVYKDKCQHMLQELDAYFPSEVTYTRPEGGLFIWCSLPEYIDGEEFAKELIQQEKIAVVPGSAFLPENGKTSSIRLNFSKASKEDATKGIQGIARLLDKLIK